jgi:hypothetical protein
MNLSESPTMCLYGVSRMHIYNESFDLTGSVPDF